MRQLLCKAIIAPEQWKAKLQRGDGVSMLSQKSFMAQGKALR